ncbi:sugar-binding domain-containing protein [Promicromonospora xylanilytica]
MLEVAKAYYIEDRSKVQIAEETGLSRWQVARVLNDAREEGLVTIQVADEETPRGGLAERLQQALGLRRAIVAPARALRPDAGVEAVAQALATYLGEAVAPGESLAIGWSRAIEAMPARLQRLAPCDVVQLAGALTFSGDRVGSVEVIRQVARTAGGTAYPVYAPLVAPTADIATSLLSAPEIADVMKRAEHADHAVVGIGTWTKEGSSILPLLPPDLVRRTAAAGAAAVVSGRVMDDEGRPLDVGVDGRIVGLTLAQLRSVPNIIGTCVGAHRADAVRSAVRSGLVDVLIVDESLAAALLEM